MELLHLSTPGQWLCKVGVDVELVTKIGFPDIAEVVLVEILIFKCLNFCYNYFLKYRLLGSFIFTVSLWFVSSICSPLETLF